MNAVVYTGYGSPDVLKLTEVEKPMPKENEVLIKSFASTVSSVDVTFRSGESWSGMLYTGLVNPKRPTLGSTLAGEIEAVGKAVKAFKPGDQVYGTIASFVSHADYICLPEDGAITSKPATMSYEEAVAITPALTALPFLRDDGHIQAGQKVLINGASGGVGTVAVQLAKYFGADVTGVCSTTKVEFVKSLGADRVIDYTQEDFTRNGETYDIIFDVAGKSAFSRCKKALKPNGIYLSTVLSTDILLQMARTSIIGSKKAVIAFAGLRSASDQANDLAFLNELVEEGKIRATIDSRYPLQEIVKANRYFDEGSKKGSVVVAVDHGRPSSRRTLQETRQ